MSKNTMIMTDRVDREAFKQFQEDMAALEDRHQLELEPIEERHAAEVKELQQKAGPILAPIFKDFFDKFPQVKTISWTQYTPYFNDGEECTFRINEVYFSGAEYDPDVHTDNTSLGCEYENDSDAFAKFDYGKKYEPGNIARDAYDRTSEELRKAMDSLESKLEGHRDMLLAILDDHAWIVVNREGIHVNTHEHE